MNCSFPLASFMFCRSDVSTSCVFDSLLDFRQKTRQIYSRIPQTAYSREGAQGEAEDTAATRSDIKPPVLIASRLPSSVFFFSCLLDSPVFSPKQSATYTLPPSFRGFHSKREREITSFLPGFTPSTLFPLLSPSHSTSSQLLLLLKVKGEKRQVKPGRRSGLCLFERRMNCNLRH